MTRLNGLCTLRCAVNVRSMCDQNEHNAAPWQDGRAATMALQHACLQAGARCSLLFSEAVEGLLMEEPAAGSNGRRASGVRTAARRCPAV